MINFGSKEKGKRNGLSTSDFLKRTKEKENSPDFPDKNCRIPLKLPSSQPKSTKLYKFMSFCFSLRIPKFVTQKTKKKNQKKLRKISSEEKGWSGKREKKA